MTTTRRDFLRWAVGAALAVPFGAACGAAPGSVTADAGRIGALDGGTLVPDGGEVVPDDGGVAGADAGVCEATHADVLGPFHRPGAPFQVVIAAADEPGERLFIAGVVYGPDCRTPIEGAVVDVWQANQSGRYDNDDPRTPPPPNDFRLRGRMTTDASGRYAFESVYPGRYLNGARYRPAHVHYRVSASGRTQLTTQLYFEGDPFNDGDAFWEASRTIELRRDPRGAHGTFDVVLA